MPADVKLRKYTSNDEYSKDIEDQTFTAWPGGAGTYFTARVSNVGDASSPIGLVKISEHTGSDGKNWGRILKTVRPQFPRIHGYYTRFQTPGWAAWGGTPPAAGTQLTLLTMWANTALVDTATVTQHEVTIMGNTGSSSGIMVDSNFGADATETGGLYWPLGVSNTSIALSMLWRQSDGAYWMLYNQSGSPWQTTALWYDAGALLGFPGRWFWSTPYINGPFPALPNVGSRSLDPEWDECQVPTLSGTGPWIPGDPFWTSGAWVDRVNAFNEITLDYSAVPMWKKGIPAAANYMVSAWVHDLAGASFPQVDLSWGNPRRFNISVGE